MLIATTPPFQRRAVARNGDDGRRLRTLRSRVMSGYSTSTRPPGLISLRAGRSVHRWGLRIRIPRASAAPLTRPRGWQRQPPRTLATKRRHDWPGRCQAAAAIGVGVFIGCLPLFGSRLWICAGLASATRLEPVEVVPGGERDHPAVGADHRVRAHPARQLHAGRRDPPGVARGARPDQPVALQRRPPCRVAGGRNGPGDDFRSGDLDVRPLVVRSAAGAPDCGRSRQLPPDRPPGVEDGERQAAVRSRLPRVGPLHRLARGGARARPRVRTRPHAVGAGHAPGPAGRRGGSAPARHRIPPAHGAPGPAARSSAARQWSRPT